MGEILNRKLEELKLTEEALEQVSGGRKSSNPDTTQQPQQVLEIQCSCGNNIRFTGKAKSVRCKYCGEVHKFYG
jgi:hypothetical protein